MDARALAIALYVLVGVGYLVVSVLVARGAGLRSPANRTLFAYGAFIFVSNLPVVLYATPLAEDPSATYHFAIFSASTGALITGAYLLFVAQAVRVPLTRPLASPAGRWSLLALMVVGAAAPWLAPRAFFDAPLFPGPLGPEWTSTPAFLVVSQVQYILPPLFGLVVAVWAWKAASPGSVARRQALAYMVAFGFQDLNIIGHRLVPVFAPDFLLRPEAPVVSGVLGVVSAGILAIALLRFQLLDLDLKLKWTLRRGTLVGIFLAAFFVAAAIAEQYVQQQFGLLAGGVVVGLLLFAMRPIERAADRVANAAMPRVQDTDEYRTVRRREVYRAAVESAMEDGAITDRERSVLATLAQELGLGPKDALDIEREARGLHASAAQA